MNFLVVGAIVTVIFFVSFAVQSSSAQMKDHGSTDGSQSTNNLTDSPPVIMVTGDGNIDVKLSWEPEQLDAEQPAKFAVEFLNHETGLRLSKVSYAVHMTVDGKSIGHGHDGTAPNGTAEFELSFDSAGNLSMVVEVQKAGGIDINQVAQFSVAVTPELPFVTLVLLVGVAGAVAASAKSGIGLLSQK